ncbi:septum formation family protein [Actinosynnema mirum]|uniref:Septum formation-related domain-containing protein n=1 Tax=Actinosynnema mirum (strain ATCC 29888 / DSM 43827 / JCM 3225 / NBRC 14064 / NCIMB 13271 / NRRL B-12336 / IMRU 3971 / 101) TaxID=446462 RepID=C6WSB8_ACTMD|nr:septum formation family protein [Actinosynnema mirum]ACU40788.1 hypothetical protein Amir_6995 [Actinosynnema mirum DSM 43827]
MRRWRALSGLLAVVAVVLAGCTEQVGGTPDGAVLRPSITPAASELPQPGACVDQDLKAVDCAAPHVAEVTAVGDLTGVEQRTERDLRRVALPACRAALAGYLGAADHDATRVQAQAIWPSEDGWARGDRWRLCTAVEISPTGQQASRTGSLAGLLKATGFASVQLCTSGSPARDEALEIVACDASHLAEAVPGVLALGGPQDAPLSQEQVNAAASEHCAAKVNGYVGAVREDVFASWRSFGSQAWSEGFTTAVCYAEAARPFTGRLWGLGRGPLPE